MHSRRRKLEDGQQPHCTVSAAIPRTPAHTSSGTRHQAAGGPPNSSSPALAMALERVVRARAREGGPVEGEEPARQQVRVSRLQARPVHRATPRQSDRVQRRERRSDPGIIRDRFSPPPVGRRRTGNLAAPAVAGRRPATHPACSERDAVDSRTSAHPAPPAPGPHRRLPVSLGATL